jgi:universal stress protein A
MKNDRVRVLVPLESGESAGEPARLLGTLFSPTAVRVRALHVAPVAVPRFYLPAGLYMDSLRREQLAWEVSARRILERETRPLKDRGFAVETEVTAGSPLAEILKRARLWRSDLILARPKRGRAAAGGLGGVATGLMQTATGPVLLYRRVSSGYRVGTILAPVDFSPFSRDAIGWALLLASLARARVRLLHVLPAASSRWAPRLRRVAVEMVRQERQRAQRQLRELGDPGTVIEALVVERKDPAQGILEAQKEDVSLVIVGASGKTGLNAVLGSVTRSVARSCPCPVLVIPTTSRISAVDVWRRSRRGRAVSRSGQHKEKTP